jgi:hypothetical protein
LDLINQKNLLMPDLRFTSTYDLNGLGSHLDGGSSDPNNAFHSLATDKFNDWSLGLRLTVPLGFRDSYAAVRAAHLNLARSYTVLRDEEQKAQRFLTNQYRNVFRYQTLIASQRARREAEALQIESRFKNYLSGVENATIFLLAAERNWSDALVDEYRSIADYNIALSLFDYGRGAMLQRDNVVISEGELPHVSKVRASEHERERSKALVLRERAHPIHAAESHSVEGENIQGLPELPKSDAPSIPQLMEGEKEQPPLPDSLPEYQPPQYRPEEVPTPTPLPKPSPTSERPTAETAGVNQPGPATLPLSVPLDENPKIPAVETLPIEDNVKQIKSEDIKADLEAKPAANAAGNYAVPPVAVPTPAETIEQTAVPSAVTSPNMDEKSMPVKLVMPGVDGKPSPYAGGTPTLQMIGTSRPNTPSPYAIQPPVKTIGQTVVPSAVSSPYTPESTLPAKMVSPVLNPSTMGQDVKQIRPEEASSDSESKSSPYGGGTPAVPPFSYSTNISSPYAIQTPARTNGQTAVPSAASPYAADGSAPAPVARPLPAVGSPYALPSPENSVQRLLKPAPGSPYGPHLEKNSTPAGVASPTSDLPNQSITGPVEKTRPFVLEPMPPGAPVPQPKLGPRTTDGPLTSVSHVQKDVSPAPAPVLLGAPRLRTMDAPLTTISHVQKKNSGTGSEPGTAGETKQAPERAPEPSKGN